jgi:hypothetical protein
MYAKNIQNLLELLIKNGAFAPDYDDEIVKGTVITRNGEVVHEMTKQRVTEAGKAPSPPVSPPPITDASTGSSASTVQTAGVVIESVDVVEIDAGGVELDEIAIVAAESAVPEAEIANAGNGAARPMGIRAEELVTAPAGAIAGDGTHNCPPDFPIKANAQSQIYHPPGSSSYDQTIPEFCFATAEGAEAAGFRASRT